MAAILQMKTRFPHQRIRVNWLTAVMILSQSTLGASCEVGLGCDDLQCVCRVKVHSGYNSRAKCFTNSVLCNRQHKVIWPLVLITAFPFYLKYPLKTQHLSPKVTENKLLSVHDIAGKLTKHLKSRKQRNQVYQALQVDRGVTLC